MKERLDVLLVKRGLAVSREKAKAVIMSGCVYVENQKEDKAGSMFADTANIEVRGNTLKYVSRGGLKLEKAVSVFNIDFSGKKVLDVGASTGGFTDCALQNGAEFVYSVDVGTNQLDWKLRNNPQVKSLENMHIKDLTLEDIDNNKVDYIVMDVSFISIKKIIGDLVKFFKPETKLMALIKPQFEVEKEHIAKGGIVKDDTRHIEVIKDIIEYGKKEGLYLEGLDFSPITGTKGNVEYISLFGKDSSKEIYISIEEIVEKGRSLGGTI